MYSLNLEIIIIMIKDFFLQRRFMFHLNLELNTSSLITSQKRIKNTRFKQ